MKVCIITTSRADWNGLSVLAKALEADKAFSVFVLAASQHSGANGTGGIVMDDFPRAVVAPEVTMSNSDGCGNVAGLLTHGLATALGSAKPDMAIILGDRWETLSAATACLLSGIPIAHLDGGDITDGSFDDQIRHAVTKMSHLHFPTNYEAEDRILQMGEDCDHIHMVGSTHVDKLLATGLLPVKATLSTIGGDCGPFPREYVVVNWQPETLAEYHNKGLGEILYALSADLGPAVLFVGQNADPKADEATSLIRSHVRRLDSPKRRRRYVANLPAHIYLSALKHSICLIGNSSSAFYEAPYLRTWAINVGARQSGRAIPGQHNNVLDRHSVLAIAAAISLCPDSKPPKSAPYGDGDAAEKIVDVLREVSSPKTLLRKRFFTPSR